MHEEERTREFFLASDEEAAASLRELDDVLAGGRDAAVRVRAHSGEEIDLPHPVREALGRVVREMARGNAVRVLPVRTQLTTQQAAELLNVPPPFLVRLLDAGEIPYGEIGGYRRVRLNDLLAYKEKRDRERLEALDRLTAESQELGLYDA